MNFRRLLASVACLATLGGTVLAQQKIQINGAGATFPYPIYSKWFSEYNKLHPNIEINYQPIGSGGGIRQITNQTVFFGATDGPMTSEQLLAAPSRILHFPTVLGAVLPVYNIPGVNAELKFTGPLLADIFLGKVTKWNDPAITKLNPGVKLPGTDITVCHRSDGSGQNMAGEFVRATTESVSAAAGAAARQMPADFRVSITNAPGSGVYPISSFTWLLFFENPKDKQRARIMADFMKWA